MSSSNTSGISDIRKEALFLLLASIELEASGLSHVINMKKEVIQSTLKCVISPEKNE